MRTQEIAVPEGNGSGPDVLDNGVGGITIPANTLVVASWTAVQQKILFDLPSYAGTCYVAIGRDTVSAETVDAIVLDSDRTRLVIGSDRPHRVQKLAILSTVELHLSGESKNCTLIGWG